MLIGAQLYTLRDFCKTTQDLDETLKRVADMGITTVQLSGVCAYTPEWVDERCRAYGLTADITGRRVIIVEDIVDTGNTIIELKNILAEAGAAESRICTLLYKPEACRKDITLDYVAMEIPNDFIVGFGLDYDELGRNLKDIYTLVQE